MSEPIAPGAQQSPAEHDMYESLLGSVRARFKAITVKNEGKSSLFSTTTPDLYDAYLQGLAPAHRQMSTCATCRKFVSRYGSLVIVAPDGKTVPVLWDPAPLPPRYAGAIRALAEAVSAAPIEGVFLSEEKTWGVPQTGAWTHLAVTPAEALVFKPSVLKTTSQIVAEKSRDFETLVRGLDEFPLEIVRNAHALLTNGSLLQAEKCVGVAKWLLDLHTQRKGAKNQRARENLTWLAVGSAPVGFCHVRSTMIGTLLEDIKSGLPFAEIKAKFAAKLDPLLYQRAQVAPTAGNIAQAERNPVTWYVYHNGSTPTRWNLVAGAYHPVSAVALSPSMWSATRSFSHQSQSVAFVLENARDTEYTSGASFFPSLLKSEFHEIRATMEAYAKDAVVEGKGEPAACGICLSMGGTWNFTFRVTAKDGSRSLYKLDRWD